MTRFTDERFVNKRWYAPSDHQERLEILDSGHNLTINQLYDRLAAYENTGLTPEEIMRLKEEQNNETD